MKPRKDCRCACHRNPAVVHIIACCFDLGGCDFDMCTNEAVRVIRYDTNNYENDKYCRACEEHLKHEV